MTIENNRRSTDSKIDDIYEIVIELRTQMEVIAERGCSVGHKMNEKTKSELKQDIADVEQYTKNIGKYVKGVGVLGMSVGTLIGIILSKFGLGGK